VVVEIGLISPPVGMNLFVINALPPQVPHARCFTACCRSWWRMWCGLCILVAFPIISLWLPSLMR
jgi:TRAP-type C4-dicarboxylate transport system permease large subunit